MMEKASIRLFTMYSSAKLKLFVCVLCKEYCFFVPIQIYTLAACGQSEKTTF